MLYFVTWLLKGLKLHLVYKSGWFPPLHIGMGSGTFPSPSVRVLAPLILKQGHCGEINEGMGRAKRNEQVTVERPGAGRS